MKKLIIILFLITKIFAENNIGYIFVSTWESGYDKNYLTMYPINKQISNKDNYVIPISYMLNKEDLPNINSTIKISKNNILFLDKKNLIDTINVLGTLIDEKKCENTDYILTYFITNSNELDICNIKTYLENNRVEVLKENINAKILNYTKTELGTFMLIKKEEIK